MNQARKLAKIDPFTSAVRAFTTLRTSPVETGRPLSGANVVQRRTELTTQASGIFLDLLVASGVDGAQVLTKDLQELRNRAIDPEKVTLNQLRAVYHGSDKGLLQLVGAVDFAGRTVAKCMLEDASLKSFETARHIADYVQLPDTKPTLGIIVDGARHAFTEPQ